MSIRLKQAKLLAVWNIAPRLISLQIIANKNWQNSNDLGWKSRRVTYRRGYSSTTKDAYSNHFSFQNSWVGYNNELKIHNSSVRVRVPVLSGVLITTIEYFQLCLYLLFLCKKLVWIVSLLFRWRSEYYGEEQICKGTYSKIFSS